jgi:hypothetical protein
LLRVRASYEKDTQARSFHMRIPLALVAVVMTVPVSADDTLADQIDIVAPLVNAHDITALGGPGDHVSLVAAIEGRWFTLDTTVRNWEGSGEPDRERLNRAVERLCSDGWENIVTHEVIGPDRFRILQRSPDGKDQGTFEMKPVAGSVRSFSFEADDAYILGIYGLTHAEASRQKEVLTEMRSIEEKGAELWVPTPDLMVSVSASGTEVWGRCPAP